MGSTATPVDILSSVKCSYSLFVHVECYVVLHVLCASLNQLLRLCEVSKVASSR